MYTTLISAEDLQSIIGKDTVVLDCRFDLANSESGREAYTQSHIPGAFYLHLNNDLSGDISPLAGRHPLPGIEQITQTFADCGIRQTTQVVAYDASGGCYAARAWWLLRALGHESVAVLDGGFKHWCERGNVVDRRIPQVAAGRLRPVKEWQLPVVSLEQMQTLVSSPDATIIDARDTARYNGDVEPIDPKAGHIPNAVNKPWAESLDSDGLFKAPEFHKQRWQGQSSATHYCGSGVTACVNLLSHAIGTGAIPALYPGGWSQWCHHKV